uniref:MARVEL domain-containing protein n=1 Tax=Panagrellus redivivus TaxID=6233 RepID=A0A7E4W5B8_PANRE
MPFRRLGIRLHPPKCICCPKIPHNPGNSFSTLSDYDKLRNVRKWRFACLVIELFFEGCAIITAGTFQRWSQLAVVPTSINFVLTLITLLSCIRELFLKENPDIGEVIPEKGRATDRILINIFVLGLCLCASLGQPIVVSFRWFALCFIVAFGLIASVIGRFIVREEKDYEYFCHLNGP